MKKILLSLMVIATVAVLLGTGLYSHFNDCEESTSTFQAGTLDLKFDGDLDTFTSDNLECMAPCDWFVWDVHELQNVGCLPGVLTLCFQWQDLPGDFPEPEWIFGNTGELSGYLDIVVVYCWDGELTADMVADSIDAAAAKDALLDAGVPIENIKYADVMADIPSNSLPCITLDDKMESMEASTLQILVHVEQPDDPDTEDVNEANMLQGDIVSVTKSICLTQWVAPTPP